MNPFFTGTSMDVFVRRGSTLFGNHYLPEGS